MKEAIMSIQIPAKCTHQSHQIHTREAGWGTTWQIRRDPRTQLAPVRTARQLLRPCLQKFHTLTSHPGFSCGSSVPPWAQKQSFYCENKSSPFLSDYLNWKKSSQVWWQTPVISSFSKKTQGDCHKFQASLAYIMNSGETKPGLEMWLSQENACLASTKVWSPDCINQAWRHKPAIPKF